MRIKIGDLLVKAGVITELQLKAALAEQSQWGGKLGDILVRMEFLTEEILVRALSKQTGIPRADLGGEGSREALALVPAEVAEEFGVVPVALKEEGRALVVAMSGPLNISVSDHLRSLPAPQRIDAPPPPAAPVAAAPVAGNGNSRQSESAGDVLHGVEEAQRRSVAALKAMVELLIEKGVFSRDEYLARVKR